MSGALAMATVSALLREMLQERMDQLSEMGLDKIAVNALLPDLVRAAPDTGDHLDLFLYLATPNAGWRNVGLPARDSAGAEVGAPPLALNLHYLLSASSTKDLYAESMLGYALQLLHETPVLARDVIRGRQKAWAQNEHGLLKSLAADPLSEQIELVKVSPETVRAEDVAKLWSGFQIKYRPCAAFLASVVLIESTRTFEPAPPVAQARVHAIPFARPYIQSLAPQVAVSGGSIVIQGQNLASPSAEVRFNAISLSPDEQGPLELRVTIPAEVRAGVVTVQVVHSFDIGGGLKPPRPKLEFESNAAVLVLRPRIVSLTQQAAGLQLELAPKVGKEQKVTLLLDETSPAPGHDALAWRIDAPADNGVAGNKTETGAIVFPLSGVLAGEYFVRVQVDGSLSALDLDPDSPEYGPRVTFA